MADVATNIKGTTEKNGTIVTGVDMVGNYHTIDATVNDAADKATLDSRFDGRFDDVRYYTGDSAS